MASQEAFTPQQVTAACIHSVRAILSGRYNIQLSLSALQAPSAESVKPVLALFDAANNYFDKPFNFQEDSQAFCAVVKPTCLPAYSVFCLQLYRQYAEPQMPHPAVHAFSELYKAGTPLQCCNNFDKDFLRARFAYTEHEGLLQLFPYLYAKDWEVTPGRSQDGKGDLVLTDGIGSYLVLQMQYIDDRTGHTARVQRTAKRKKVLDQAVRYTEKFVELHPESIVVLGAAYTNERGVQWLGDQQKGCQPVVQALLMVASQKPRPVEPLYTPDLLPSLQVAMARRLASFDMPQPGSPSLNGLPGMVDQAVNMYDMNILQAVADLQLQNAAATIAAAAEQAEFEAVERADSTSADAAVYLAHLASGGSFTHQPLFMPAHRQGSMPNMGSFTSLRSSFNNSITSHALNDPLIQTQDAGDGYDTPTRRTDSPGPGTPSAITNAWLATHDLLSQQLGMEMQANSDQTQDPRQLQMLPQSMGMPLQQQMGTPTSEAHNGIWNPFQSQCFSLRMLSGVPEADSEVQSPSLRSASHTGAIGEKPTTPRLSLRAASVSVVRHNTPTAAAAAAAAATAAISEPELDFASGQSATLANYDYDAEDGCSTPVKQEAGEDVDTPISTQASDALADSLAEFGLAQRTMTFPGPNTPNIPSFEGLEGGLRQSFLERQGTGGSDASDHLDFSPRVGSATAASLSHTGSPLGRPALMWDAALNNGLSPKQASIMSKPRSSSVPRASHLGGHHSPVPGSPRPHTPPANMLPSLPSISTGMASQLGQLPLPNSKLSFISSNAQWADMVAHLRGQCQGMARLYKRWAEEVDTRQCEEEQIHNFFRLWVQQMAARPPARVGGMVTVCQNVLERAMQLEREITHMHDAWLSQVQRRKKLQEEVAELYRQWNLDCINQQQRMPGSPMAPQF